MASKSEERAGGELTSVFEAVVQEAGVSARGKVVRNGILGIRVRQGKPGFVLIRGQDLRMTRHQLPCQVVVGGDQPLANRVLGDRRILFATGGQMKGERCAQHSLKVGLVGLAHPWSLEIRGSASSLPRNPLAKGLFSIFSWVI